MNMMTPSQLRDYLKEHRQASLADLSIHFASQPDAIKAAMETWIRKGKAQVIMAEPECGKSCCQCKTENVTIYRWQEANIIA